MTMAEMINAMTNTITAMIMGTMASAFPAVWDDVRTMAVHIRIAHEMAIILIALFLL